MTRARRSLLAFCLAAAVAASGLAVSGQSPGLDPATAIVGRDDPSEGLTVRERDRDGRVRFAAVEPSRRGIRVPRSAAAAAEERALAFIDRYGDHFGLSSRAQLRLKRRSADALGDHVRFEQLHQGIPVTGGELIAHLRGNEVTAVNGAIFGQLPASVVPTLSPLLATASAQLVVADLEPTQAAGARYSLPRLEIWVPEAFGDRVRTPRLAYFVEARGDVLRRFIWIDALTGETLISFSQLTDAKNRSVYTANGGSQLPGSLVRSEGGLPTGDTDTDLAYDYAGATYDYYKNTHNRDSYDGLGAALISTVHYCDPGSPCPWSNAFWSGTQMVYGDGFASADDVVAHELTHAVTERSAGLFYYRESGALNESFSDVFGETVDLTDGAGTDTGAVRWSVGEDLPIGAIRNMLTPALFNDPGKRSDPQYMCDLDFSGLQDNGGVHTNSGIPNHAYALVVDGGTYNGRTILPLGLTKADKIWYRALTVYLTPSASFRDAYLALSQSATDLIGTNGITASDRDQVVSALLAVEMDRSESDVCLHLTSTNGGLTRTVGVGQSVLWNSTGLNPSGQIYLLLSKDGGLTEYPTPIAVLPSTATSYFWTPAPEHVTGTARLFVGSLVNGEYEAGDWSDANFSVVASTAVPTVTTNTATALTQTTATLNALVNPNGLDATLFFDYGPTTSYGTTVSPGSIGHGIASASAAYTVTGLSCGATYQFRARAQNAAGTTSGSNMMFTTSACPQPPAVAPTVTTGGSSSITGASATVAGTVNPNGSSTTLYFDYGPTVGYGSVAFFGVVGSGTSPFTGLLTLSGLSCNTAYHYRARGQSSGGTGTGVDQTFTTSACPVPLPNVFAKTAPANGAAGQAPDVTLTWAPANGAASYEYCVDTLNNNACDGSWTSTAATSATVNGLTAGTTYWWQARARSASGTTDANGGLWWGFTTLLPAGTYFIERFEGSPDEWSQQAPWAQTTESAHGGLRAFSDSPGGNYGPNVNLSLTSPEIDLRTATAPQVRFWHRYGLAADGDNWNVWVTTDDGQSFVHQRQFTGTNLTWTESTIDLSSFAGLPSVRLLFQLLSNGSGSGDGLYLDDIVVEEAGPPLPSVSVTASDANAAETGSDPGVFTFTRTGATTASLTVNFTTAGTATVAADYADTGWASVTIPAGQASATKTVTPSTDALAEGPETVVVTLAAGSYTIGAPSSATVSIADASIAGQDLVVSSATAPPAAASPGSTYSITDTTLNQGANATTVVTSTRFYLSFDTVKNTGDRLLSGARSVAALAGGASSSGSTTVTIPTSTPPGIYFQLACADDGRVAPESNENNNCLASATTVQVMLPDLQPTAVSDPPANIAVGGRFTVTDTVFNPSAVSAGMSATRFYLSLDGVKDASDLLLSGTRSVASLAGGASSSGSAQLTVPVTTPLQTYRLIACDDDLAKVAETNETNNCLAAAGSVIVGAPDLVTTQLGGVPATVARGGTMALTDTVVNQGSAAAGPSSTFYYLSFDTAWSASDVLLTGGRSVPTLAAGASSAGSRNVSVPATTPAGAYFVLACADDQKRVSESNETNNCRASAATVAVGP